MNGLSRCVFKFVKFFEFGAIFLSMHKVQTIGFIIFIVSVAKVNETKFCNPMKFLSKKRKSCDLLPNMLLRGNKIEARKKKKRQNSLFSLSLLIVMLDIMEEA